LEFVSALSQSKQRQFTVCATNRERISSLEGALTEEITTKHLSDFFIPTENEKKLV
jgi:hypothetical protein